MPFKEETFTFIWKIENFNFSTKRFGESIISPCFKLQSMDKTNWYLKCYPRGVRNRFFIVIKLHRGEDSGPETIDIGFKAYVIAFDGSFPFIEETDSIYLQKGNEIKIIRELRDTFLNRPRILSNGDTF
ncbi:MATH domain-containing protein [Caerostris extrusa]|uniref:MATH domain-containing protein n=1 Tax=Caerostris extrusa TaxID=172846 RepID=A0AAV4RB14_CAEEX|nr:MATH domain-containing protein [Caerostris extrusa]